MRRKGVKAPEEKYLAHVIRKYHAAPFTCCAKRTNHGDFFFFFFFYFYGVLKGLYLKCSSTVLAKAGFYCFELCSPSTIEQYYMGVDERGKLISVLLRQCPITGWSWF